MENSSIQAVLRKTASIRSVEYEPTNQEHNLVKGQDYLGRHKNLCETPKKEFNKLTRHSHLKSLAFLFKGLSTGLMS